MADPGSGRWRQPVLSARSARLVLTILPLLAAIAAHFWALRGSFVNYDVHKFLLENPLTISPLSGGFVELLTTPKLGYPIPVTVLLFAAERSLFGLDPLAFHAVSLLLHLAVVATAFALAVRLGASRGIASALTGIFAIHPLTVEPVAWVVGQKDLLATLLVLALLFVRAHPDGETRRRQLIVFALALLALFSKPSTVCIPLLVIIIDWALERSVRRGALLALATAAVGIAVIALSIWSHETQTHTGVSAAFSSNSFAEAAWAVSLQASHVFAPTELTPRYVEPTGTLLYLGAALGLAIAAGLIALIISRVRRGDRITAAGLLLFGAAYGPIAGIVPITRGPADSYMYLPLALLAATMGPAIGRFVLRSKRLAILLLVVCSVALTVLSATAHYNWTSSLRLWSALLEKYPDHPLAKLRMAQTLLHERRPLLALAALEEIEREHAPAYTAHRWFLADTLAMVSRFQEADAMYALVIKKRSADELSHYGYFLVAVPVEPSDPELAAAALRHIGPALLASKSSPRTLERAAQRAEGLGLLELAAKLRARRALDP